MKGVGIGRKSLFAERRRAFLGIAGVAAALLMALLLDGVLAGVTRQLTRYIDSSPADVFVSQRGVRTMHMSSSNMPDDAVQAVRQVAGVSWVEPILYLSGAVTADGERQLSYLVGYRPGAKGKPEIVQGREPGVGEIVLDDRAAAAMGVDIGETVTSLGRTWRVSGFTTGLTNIANSVSFLRFEDFAAAANSTGTANYLLVGTSSDAAQTAVRIERKTGLTAQTRQRFSDEEGRLVSDMSADLLTIMTTASFLIGLMVIGLTLYAGTLARMREIGVIKALGGGTRRLVEIVLSQAAWTVGPAVVIAMAMIAGMVVIVPVFSDDVSIAVQAGSVIRVVAAAIALAALGAAAPLVKVARVDPATVFRR